MHLISNLQIQKVKEAVLAQATDKFAEEDQETVRRVLDMMGDALIDAGPDGNGRPVVHIPRQVQRREDMSHDGYLQLHLQADGDVVLVAHGRDCGDETTATVEFCTVGAGGGRSPRTRFALKALMAAMQADNDAEAKSGIALRDFNPPVLYCLAPKEVSEW